MWRRVCLIRTLDVHTDGERVGYENNISKTKHLLFHELNSSKQKSDILQEEKEKRVVVQFEMRGHLLRHHNTMNLSFTVVKYPFAMDWHGG